MATLNIPNSFTAGTAAVASQVNANFTAVKSFVEAISAGTNIDAGAVTAAKLAADATNLFVPVGGLVPYGGSVAPAGGKWLLADGTAVSRTTYSALFGVVGTTYGVGDGSTTFNLPNLKGRVVVGLDATQTEFDALGETGGDKNGVAAHSHTLSGGVSVANNTTGVTVDSLAAGSHFHSGTTNLNGNHYHVMDVDQLDSAVSHGHGLDGTLASGTTATPDGDTAAATLLAGDHQHTFSTDYAVDHDHGISLSDGGHGHSVTNTMAVVSAGTTSGNLQPYVVLNYLIRVA